MKRRRKRKVKNDYGVGLVEDGHGLGCEMETYSEIGVGGICA
jgi:hypothetical protein